MARLTPPGNQILACKAAGFAYVALLAALAGLALMAGVATEQIEHAAQRDREEQLLFVGSQFRQAIASYYEKSPGIKRYPGKLEELLQDNRFPKPIRHLRRIYVDPMSNQADWQLLSSTMGGIIGVNSRSRLPPIRTKPDAELLRATGNRPVRHYADWKFIYLPRDGSAALATANENNNISVNPNNPFGQLGDKNELDQ